MKGASQGTIHRCSAAGNINIETRSGFRSSFGHTYTGLHPVRFKGKPFGLPVAEEGTAVDVFFGDETPVAAVLRVVAVVAHAGLTGIQWGGLNKTLVAIVLSPTLGGEEYLAQVEGRPSRAAVRRLREGGRLRQARGLVHVHHVAGLVVAVEVGLVGAVLGMLAGFVVAPGLRAMIKAFGADMPATGVADQTATLTLTVTNTFAWSGGALGRTGLVPEVGLEPTRF